MALNNLRGRRLERLQDIFLTGTILVLLAALFVAGALTDQLASGACGAKEQIRGDGF